MAKKANQFVCTNCGAVSATWAGKCFSCGEWNTLEQQAEIVVSSHQVKGNSIESHNVRSIRKAVPESRISTQIDELDLVLGGGLVPGSVNLLAGQPGIGKSTLLLQLANQVAAKQSVLYISGEESSQQVAMRADRLDCNNTKLDIASSTSADDIATTIALGKYALVVVDSIQTISLKDVSSAPGSVSQITNSTHILTAAAKQTNTALLLVGHVTKEGSIAGPKILEHVVDVVLQLEGDRYGGFKVLRGVKNRYGSTNETGIFEMEEDGMRAVDNPSQALLAERQVSDGSIVLATMEGSRPLLVEVQALVNTSSYGYPKRAASGVDINRVNLLIAMLERRTKLNLSDKDIYVNIVGGMKINEPAADLAICMAIASASKGMQLKKNVVVFGEVGLSGEIRHVPQADKRLAEAKKLGFVGALGPAIKQKKLSGLYSCSNIREALNMFLEK